MEFIEVSTFRRSAAGLLDEDDLAALQTLLMLHPDAGAVMPGAGGLRKGRVPAKGKGKRGGARVIYYWFTADDQIFSALRLCEKRAHRHNAKAGKGLSRKPRPLNRASQGALLRRNDNESTYEKDSV